MFGHTLGRSLGMGYVGVPDGASGADAVLRGHYEVEVAGERFVADVSLQPWYDPRSLRVRDVDASATPPAITQ